MEISRRLKPLRKPIPGRVPDEPIVSSPYNISQQNTLCHVTGFARYSTNIPGFRLAVQGFEGVFFTEYE